MNAYFQQPGKHFDHAQRGRRSGAVPAAVRDLSSPIPASAANGAPGVKVAGWEVAKVEPRLKYEPGNPDAVKRDRTPAMSPTDIDMMNRIHRRPWRPPGAYECQFGLNGNL